MAERLGKPYMPWQRMVADVAGEVVFDESLRLWRPAYSEVLVTIPRQNGKTTLMLSWSFARLIAWEAWDKKPQSVAYTAQTGSDARQKFRDEWVPILQLSPLWPGVRKAYFAADNTGLDMADGGMLKVLNSSATAGHGKVIDAAAMDEIFADADSSREQAMVPAMATRHDAQTLMVSTAGDERSTFLFAKQQAGRAAVEAGERRDIAYFEWSAHPDDDPEDPATWWSCMPALGYTITEDKVRQSLKQMAANDPDWSERRRAFLNIPKTSAAGRVIPEPLWQAVVRPDVQLSGGQALAVDAHADRSSASIVLADSQYRAKLVAHSEGTAWLLPMLTEHAKRLRVPVALDMRGPIPHLADDLEEAGVEVVRFGTADLVRACSRFWELLGDGKLSVKDAPPLLAAVESAAKRPVGDAWLWSRPQAVDASPLVALTMAVEAATGRSEWKGPPALWA